MGKKWKEKLAKSKIMRSFKLRIFVLFLLMGMIPALVMRYGVLDNYVKRAIHVRTSDVQNQMKILANHLITYNYLQDPSSEIIQAELTVLSNLYDGRVLIINENFRIIKDTYGISEGKYMISEEVIRCFKGEMVANYVEEHNYIELTTPIVLSGNMHNTKEVDQNLKKKEQVKGVMLVSVSTDNIMLSQEILGRKAMVLGIILLIVTCVVALALASVLLRPFRKITEAISEVKEGFADELVYPTEYLETEYIMNAFRKVLGRIKVLDDSRQEFVSNVSHELKTPLTSMKVLADSLLMQDEVPAELYKEFMVDIAEEIDRENKIINDLLSLVKMDKKAADMNIAMVSINQLLELILRRLRPIAIRQNVELIFESIRAVSAEVDEVKLTLALSNLIENGIKYNKENGFVRIILDADHQFFNVEITDSGMGIPEEAIGHIFERFYRVDKSHSTEIGGTGLGLAITRNAILLHRGSIRVMSTEGEGTTFSVKIPLNYLM